MELLKLININELIAQILCFFTVLFLLRLFAWKRILGLLDQRKQRIASEFKKIEDLRADIDKIKADYAGKIKEIDSLARQRINAAIAEANSISEEIKQSARDDAGKIIKGAEESIRLELSKAKEELKESVISISLAATEKIIKDRLDTEADAKVISDFLSDIEKIK